MAGEFLRTEIVPPVRLSSPSGTTPKEPRTGNVNHLGKKYTAGEAGPRDVTADQIADKSELLAEAVRDMVVEYEAKKFPEAICARDADKLECVVQGIEYRNQGYTNILRWIDNGQGGSDKCSPTDSASWGRPRTQPD